MRDCGYISKLVLNARKMECKMENPTNTILTKIREGMAVYDSAGNEIGTIAYLQMGDEDPTNLEVETATAQRPAVRDNSLVEDLAEVFAPEDGVPEEVVRRMQRQGYIRIDAGLLKPDRFALTDQISGVSSDRVTLNVSEDDLITA
jgi:hypothetical protein